MEEDTRYALGRETSPLPNNEEKEKESEPLTLSNPNVEENSTAVEENGDEEDEGLGSEQPGSQKRGKAKRVTCAASGIGFKGYTSIENSDRQKVLQEITLMGYADESIPWVATEKVHGANFSFTTDGTVIECAKRTSLLCEGDVFYNWTEMRERYREKILKMFHLCKEADKHVTLLHIYGEFFGGVYPHKELPRSEGAPMTPVQRGVYYCPHYEFYAFDVRTNITKGYMDYDKAIALFEECGFYYAKPLAIGPLEKLLQMDPAFQTAIPLLFNLPLLEKNTSEGLVLKPVKTLYFTTGSRVILKNKSEDFKEVTGLNKERVKKEHPVTLPKLPENVANLRDNLINYVSENRLRNVLSKIGNSIKLSDRGQLIGLLTRDALEDFMKDFGDEFNALSPPDKKKLTSALGTVGSKLVNDNITKIIKNEF